LRSSRTARVYAVTFSLSLKRVRIADAKKRSINLNRKKQGRACHSGHPLS